MPLQPRRGYPAALHHGLPPGIGNRSGVPRTGSTGRVRAASGHPPDSSRYVIEKRQTTVPRVCLSISLARPASSGSTDTSRLCQGRLPPSPAPPRSGCPQPRSPCCDRVTMKVSHPHSINKGLTAHTYVYVGFVHGRGRPCGRGSAGGQPHNMKSLPDDVAPSMADHGTCRSRRRELSPARRPGTARRRVIPRW